MDQTIRMEKFYPSSRTDCRKSLKCKHDDYLYCEKIKKNSQKKRWRSTIFFSKREKLFPRSKIDNEFTLTQADRDKLVIEFNNGYRFSIQVHNE